MNNHHFNSIWENNHTRNRIRQLQRYFHILLLQPVLSSAAANVAQFKNHCIKFVPRTCRRCRSQGIETQLIRHIVIEELGGAEPMGPELVGLFSGSAFKSLHDGRNASSSLDRRR